MSKELKEISEFKEKAEHAQMLQDKVNEISFCLEFEESYTSKDCKMRLNKISSIVIDSSFEHKQEIAETEKIRVLEMLNKFYNETLQREKDAQELEDLRKKQAEQEKKDYEENLKREAAENVRIEY